MKKVLMSILVLWVFVSTGYGGTVYKWVDKHGVVNFTDDYTQIPPQYRNQVQMEELEGSLKVETPASSPVSIQESKGAKVDIYGRGEDYWRAKVQPWKKQLQEATENCERINRKIDDKRMEQGGKMPSPTQFDMKRAETAQLKDERSKYEAQVREANEMLSKIAKEVEEAKANPEWLK
jgi:chromosome segregation ATPase